MASEDGDYLLISGIKHYKFCRRRWALVHIEQQWAENALTTDGHLMHETVHDSGFTEKRGSLLLSRGMPVKSESLKLSGICDMVELIKTPDGVTISGRPDKYLIYPVEYKRGRPDERGADAWHLCAQVLCLEEMFATDIPEGAIYYGETRKRMIIPITDELRNEVRAAVYEMHEILKRGHTPRVKPQKACRNCSIREICNPSIMSRGSVRDYIKEVLNDN
ncbi:MAG: CRISPR-associated protein Cas4 [Clostridiales bacterium]|nr:CRISPR-associated protein Cas4 [Clostridiales bacterium]